MAFIPAANVLQARLRFVQNSQITENTLYFQGSAGVTEALATTLGNNLIGWWNTNFKSLASNNMALLQVYITDMTAVDSFTVSVTTGLPSTGGNTSEALPNNCAFCVSFRSSARGRSGRGRNYVGGLCESDVTGNLILGSRSASLVASYNTLVGAGSFTPGLQWVIVSRFAGGVPRPSALVRPIINALAVDNVMDSQRNRLPGRGG